MPVRPTQPNADEPQGNDTSLNRGCGRRPRPNRLLSVLAVSTVTGMTLAGAPLVASAAPDAASSASPRVVVNDSFTRSVASGWGSTPSGQTYRTTASTSTSAYVDGNSAVVSLSHGQAAATYVQNSTAQDVRAESTVTMSAVGGAAYYTMALRGQSNGTAYLSDLYLTSDGVPHLKISRGTDRSSVTLAEVKVGSAAIRVGQPYRWALTVTGQNPVRIEASLTPGAVASSNPQIAYSDSSAARIVNSGRIGLLSYASGGAKQVTTAHFDNLLVQDNAAALGSTVSTPTSGKGSTGTTTPTGGGTDSTQSVPGASAGSAPVGSTNYAVPAGALFVSANASGRGDGSKATPYPTVQAAVDAAKPGSTIVLRGGVYHESVTIPYGKGLTVQSYPGEAVWFDGSVPVTNWVKSGNVWVSTGWTAKFSGDMGGMTSMFLQSGYPNANRPDQLFLDGTAVPQVASASAVTPGTFAVDYTNHRLILGSDPSGHAVRASDLSQAINTIGAGMTLQGFGVRRYATQYSDNATVRLQNVNSTIRDLVVTDNAMTGVAMSNTNDLAERVTLTRNGLQGMDVNAAYGFVLRNSLVTQNNSEHFAMLPVSCGVKITKSRGLKVINNNISGNYSTGLWFDESDYDITVVKNAMNNNRISNLSVEISAKGVIADNQMTGGDTGVSILDSGDMRLYNNEFGGNSFMSVRLRQDSRRQASATVPSQRDPQRPTVDPTVPWLTQDITVSNNVFAAGGKPDPSVGQFSIWALDEESNRPVNSWNLVINGNIFTNYAAGGPQMVAWGLGDNKSQIKYQNTAALQAAKGWKNAMTSGTPATAAAMANDIEAAKSITVPIPSDIAAVLGTSTTGHTPGVI